MADVIGQAFFGSSPIFSQMPHNLVLGHDANYLLVAVLGLVAALIGVGFKTVLYGTEDVCDALWKGRPEWLRPAVGGVILGAVLLALPEMYGIGYPVMNKAVAGEYVLWFLLVLMVGKMVAASLTIGIGGSGGVFAPSLFVGAAAGTAFGVIAQHIFGPSVGSPAIYGVIAMGAVFAGATQAPLTSIASVIEMTGNFTLSLPVMLAVGIAVGVSKRLTHGTIYTTKLLRRGTDIERPKPSSMLQVLTVADVMRPLSTRGDDASHASPLDNDRADDHHPAAQWPGRFGEIVSNGEPQVLFGDETLEQAMRQLVLFGPAVGLPVVSSDPQRVIGWVTYHDVLRTMADRITTEQGGVATGSLAAEWATPNASVHVHVPAAPLEGYTLVEVRITDDKNGSGRRIDEVELPPGGIAVAATRNRETVAARSDDELHQGDHLLCLVPVPAEPSTNDDASETTADSTEEREHS